MLIWIRSHVIGYMQPDELAKDQISGGFSGAEIVSICQEAAIFAIEEFDEMDGLTEGPKVCRRHLMKSIQVKNRQITPEMLEFYESFEKKI
jgi:SpoVK/Ycf46/Vps4 family AAA+-type ATPase